MMKGTIIQCIKANHRHTLTIGQIYVVQKTSSYGWGSRVVIFDNHGFRRAYKRDKFKILITP
jgi:hypothetical protein